MVPKPRSRAESVSTARSTASLSSSTGSPNSYSAWITAWVTSQSSISENRSAIVAPLRSLTLKTASY